MAMQPPANIGKYELLEFLGGGMARVYRARDTVIGRTVAVKILTEEGCADSDTKSRFLQEARLAGNISHDNIISIYDFGEDDQGRPFMVMEFLKGEDLRHAITQSHTGDTENKMKIALQVARALEHIHSQHIIHRDIKPDNVHVTTTGVVKLMDFGISKKMNTTLTSTGIVMGTPYYMAPEQVLGKAITEQVDVYAFGVMLFELMTGAKPITGDTVERIFYCILQEPLDLGPLRQAGIHEPVIDLITRCTDKDPARRPQGFGDVCARIQKIMNEWDASTRASKAPSAIDPALAATVAMPRAVSAAPQVSAQPPAAPREEIAPAPASSKPWLIPAVVIGLAIAGGGIYFALRSPAVVPPPAEVSNAPKIPERLAIPSGDMLVVPAGVFLFGKDKQSQSLPAFYIDKTEVSVGAYAKFCEAKGRPLPKANALDHPDYPVVDVTFDDAREFAKWAGKRLPSTQEWEKAARGTDGRLYPWGNNPDPARANVGYTNGSVTAVASFENGASPSGALNMLGNVWEWVDELRTPSALALAHFAKILDPAPAAEEPWYVIRGGSFHDQPSDAYLWDSATIPARHHDKNIGFRCAKNP